MAKAVKCPVCEGKGVVYGIAETGAMPTTKCHGCLGKGWVEVGTSNVNPTVNWGYGDIHPLGYASTSGKFGYFN